MTSRLEIPQTLWREARIRMPPCLAEALRAELVQRGLLDEACGPHIPDKELFGGKDEKETVKHFTHRFKTSAARVQFVVLNPNGTFEPLATDLRSGLLDGKVALLDIPCGSGGGLLGLLATLAELRVQACLPRLPLEVGILAGDCSQEARAIHACMLHRVQPALEEVGVRLRWQHADWDVTDAFSTAALMDQWFGFCPACEEYVVFVSAFSGLASLFSWSTRGKGEDLSEEFEYVHPFTEEVITGRARVLPLGKVSR